MSRLFTALEGAVVDLGGTVKEFQGDAIFAFWEQQSDRAFTAKACLAAIKLNDMVEKMAVDPSIWSVEGFPLTMDWAIATGVVAMAAHGAGHALGLSMVGEPVVLAYRIEKFACAETGPIVTCQKTRDAVHSQFRFSELGRHSVKGLSGEKEIYALLGEDIGPRGSP